jgi:predicted regulator of Ras-like GTPase activity (Roadblock/LC7/MglB family)
VVASPPVDARQSLDDLKRISTQVQEAVIFGADRSVEAATIQDPERAARFADAAARLLEVADSVRTDWEKPLVQLEASLDEGSVAIVRERDRAIAATTHPEPTIGLVFYDLRTSLRELAADEPTQQRRRKQAAAEETGVAEA